MDYFSYFGTPTRDSKDKGELHVLTWQITNKAKRFAKHTAVQFDIALASIYCY